MYMNDKKQTKEPSKTWLSQFWPRWSKYRSGKNKSPLIVSGLKWEKISRLFSTKKATYFSLSISSEHVVRNESRRLRYVKNGTENPTKWLNKLFWPK